MKRTRIVATIGPASNTLSMISKLVGAGVNVARLNFSHGSYEEHAHFIQMIRTVSRRTHRTVTLLQDLSGPKIRVGELPPQGVVLREGDKIILSNNPATKNGIPFQYHGLPRDVHEGDRILFDDGLMEVEVIGTTRTEVRARVIVGGTLLSHKGINVPSTRLAIPAVTDKDKKDLKFGVAHGVDWVALSFVRDPKDIEQLRTLIRKEPGKHKPKIIAKIEKHEAVMCLEEIVRAADGIMVARGDLGIEIPAEDVPLVQKRLIRLCQKYEKPVIVATQMLDSMIRNPRPTRAEVSDVANAVFDRADAVMLSGETASGKFPLEAVTIMSKIAERVETNGADLMPCDHTYDGDEHHESQLIAEISVAASALHAAKAIIIPHNSLYLLPTVSRVRPTSTIIQHVKTAAEAGECNVHFGVYPLVHAGVFRSERPDALIAAAKKMHLIARGDTIVMISRDTSGERLLRVQEFVV